MCLQDFSNLIAQVLHLRLGLGRTLALHHTIEELARCESTCRLRLEKAQVSWTVLGGGGWLVLALSHLAFSWLPASGLWDPGDAASLRSHGLLQRPCPLEPQLWASGELDTWPC